MKTMICRKCGKQHDLSYQRQINGSMHLIYYCDRFRSVIWSPYIGGLDIPTVDSRKVMRAKLEDAQGKLF